MKEPPVQPSVAAIDVPSLVLTALTYIQNAMLNLVAAVGSPGTVARVLEPLKTAALPIYPRA